MLEARGKLWTRPKLWGTLSLLLTTKLALHFICKKNSKLPSFTSLASVLGVAFGVAAFLVVVTILNSFQLEMKHIISSINPNLVVFSPRGIENISEFEKDIPELLQEPVQKVSPWIYQESILALGPRTKAAYIRAIAGTHSASADKLSPLIQPQGALASLDVSSPLLSASGNVSPNSNKNLLPHMILGRELASAIEAQVGSVVTLMTFQKKGISTSIRYNQMIVTGVLNTGINQYDESFVFMSYADGAKLFGKPNWASGVEITLPQPDKALGIAQRLKEETEYSAIAWQQIDASLFSQIQRDSTAIKLIIFIISLVAGFNVVVTLSLTVMDRAPHIALLRSLGAQKKLVLSVFVASGVFLGTVGALLGLVMGFVLLKIFSGIHLGELQKFYYLEKIPVVFDLNLALLAFLTAVGLAFLGSLYPAWRAARVSPLVGLKQS